MSCPPVPVFLVVVAFRISKINNTSKYQKEINHSSEISHKPDKTRHIDASASPTMIHLTLQNLTSKDIVQNVFSPLVAAVCSPQAEEICQKNNLSFVEMLQPFTRLSTDGKCENHGRLEMFCNEMVNWSGIG